MKRIVAGLACVLLLAGLSWASEDPIDRENISLKAGPTEPGESLSLVWVESLVYPKVLKGEKVISLGVRTALKVKGVKANFDFSSRPISLSSSDGLAWNSAFRVPDGAAEGAHAVRYQIIGRGGSIWRTVEFFVERPASLAEAAKGADEGEAVQLSGWPITVIATSSAFSDNASRILYPGQVLTGIAKMIWHKVLFEDGKEGWVSSSNVKEPTNDLWRLGAEDFKVKKYAAAIKHFQNAVNVDPSFARGYLWLAKVYVEKGDLDEASEALKKSLRLDERNLEARVVADTLAQKYFSNGHRRFRERRYREAVASFRKALDVKPDYILSYIEMGESLNRLGLVAEAQNTWREGLRSDPENAELRTRLGGKFKMAVITPADDSLQILKAEKTTKGTRIEVALKSVVALTRSLGTPVVEKGWQVKKRGEKYLISYLCEQSKGVKESFDWLVDADTRQVLAHNDNARLLMSRW